MAGKDRRLATIAVGAAIAALIVGSTGAAGAAAAPQRVLLRTGDAVAERGPIGEFAAAALDIDPRGRILVGSPLADGAQVVAWADEDGLDVLWRSGVEGPRIEAFSARASASGEHVLALADPLPYDGGPLPHQAVYELRPDGVQRRLGVGDVTADGWEVVAVRQVGGVADDDGAALIADVRPAGSEERAVSALLSLVGDVARVVAGDSDALAAERRFYSTTVLAALPDGGVVFEALKFTHDSVGSGIYRGNAAGLQPVLTVGDPHPAGGAVAIVIGGAASADGHVLARVCHPDPPFDPFGSPACPLYRSQGDAWVKIRDGIESGPDGRVIAVGGGALNRRGDVVVDATWFRPGELSRIGFGAIYHPANGAARVITREAGTGVARLNDRGETTLRSLTGGIARWSPAGRRTVVTRDAHTADGQRLIGGGLGVYSCLADDRRVATRATFADGGADWLCIDDAGAHRLPSPPASGESVELCAFAGEELAVVSNGTVARVDGRRATPVLRRGDRLPDGGTSIVVSALAANASGTIAVAASSTAGHSVLRQARGGAWQEVALVAAGAQPPSQVDALHLTASGRIVALTYAAGGRVAVVADPDGALRTLAADYQDGGERVTVHGVEVRDETALVWTSRSPNRAGPAPAQSTFTAFDARTGAVITELHEADFAGASGPLYAIGVGRDASILIGESNNVVSGVHHWLSDGGVPRRLEPPDTTTYGFTTPVALTSATDLLFRGYSSEAGARHDTLASSSARIDGVCPTADPATEDSSGGGCSVGGRPDRHGWLPAAGALVLALWSAARRRCAPRSCSCAA